MRYPDARTPPSQHGAPCPHEGDETARYATKKEEFGLLGFAFVACLALAGLLALGSL